MREDEFNKELNNKLLELIAIKDKDDLINTTIYTIEEYLDNTIEYESSKDLICESFINLNRSEFMWEKIIDISKIEIPPYNIPDTRKSISKDDLFLFVYDFYKNSTNEYLFNIFEKLFNERKSNVNFFETDDNLNGLSLYLPYYNLNYINMYVGYSLAVENVIILAHEYGHAIQDKINLQMKWEYCEIVSLFFELLCSEYYSNNVFGYEAEFEQIKRIYDVSNQSVSFSNLLKIFKKLGLDKNNKQTKRNINNLSERYAQYIINNNLNGFINYHYIVGILIASNLFNIYLEDKEKALYLLTKLINIDSNIDVLGYYKELEKLSLDSSTGFSRYRDYIVKKLD